MQDQLIGRVISVDSFRLIIELDTDVKTLYKSGFNDIYEIARINSYVSIPVGAEKIIAMITRVKINDEIEIEKSDSSIMLPKSKRYVIATMIGTINNLYEYVQGVYNFPILDNPVCYLLREDLDIIFDYKSKEEPIDFQKDYFLPIGKSPAFTEFDVKINPDKFLNKHVAVLGNTGSGKSCTIASIIQSMFRGKYQTSNGLEELTNSHIIIFDTNGEYSKAFQFEEEDLKSRVNTFTITKDGLKVPYWFMNYDDFDYLFEPSPQTQAPIFKSAIGLSKKNTQSDDESIFKSGFLLKVLGLIEDIQQDFKLKNFIKQELGGHLEFINSNLSEYKDDFEKLIEAGNKLVESRGYINGPLNMSLLKEVHESILSKMATLETPSTPSDEENIDLPTYFNFKQLFLKGIDDAIKMTVDSEQKYREYLSSLKLRLSSYYNDERISIPFMLKNEIVNDALNQFLQYILGVLTEYQQGENDFSTYRANNTNVYNPKKRSQITILDMSLLPYEVLENLTGLIGRLLLEFVQRIEKVEGYENHRGKVPIVIVLEEAQNYIPQIDKKSGRTSISKQVFEKIIREGRKYGVSLIVSSQRPSELSKTILSQCNTFIVHRLQNPEDQSYIRQLVSSANTDILNQLPILPQQHAIIMGDAVKSPLQVKLNNVAPRPGSDDPEFFSRWLDDSDDIDIKKVTQVWLGAEDS